VIELDFCCHTFLCSTDVGSQLAGEFPDAHWRVATPLSWTTRL